MTASPAAGPDLLRRLLGSPPARRAAIACIPSALVVTLLAGAAYLAAQQVLRSSANDPQIQLVEDAAVRLDAGSAPADVVGDGTVDVASSLAPFVVVYDASGGVLAAGGRLDGRAPTPPAGVLAAARANGRDLVTWQLRPGVRLATAVVSWRGGTVLAGRSLRVVEEREDAALRLAVVGWVASLAAVAVVSVLTGWLWTRLIRDA